MDARRDTWPRWQQVRRDQRAAAWRRARCELWHHETASRQRIRALWDTAPYPGDPSYLLDFLHRIAVGKIDITTLRWRMTPAEAAAAQARLAETLSQRLPAGDPSVAASTRKAATIRSYGLLTAGDHD